MNFEFDRTHGQHIAGLEQTASRRLPFNGRCASDGTQMWPIRCDRDHAMNRTNFFVQDSQIAFGMTSDQRDRHEQRSGHALIWAATNDQFAGKDFVLSGAISHVRGVGLVQLVYTC